MYNGSITANAVTPSVNMKNRIINGNMVIAQRGTSAVDTNVSYPVDRFRLAVSNSSKVSLQQSSTVPTGAGFVNSIIATSLAATVVSASNSYELSQQIEGYNIADLMWGTANAKTVTLSFWVRSSLTGTFGGTFQNSGNARSYPFSYTISSANTWEQKSITIAGDTSGTWLTDNSRGIIIRWSLGTGSNYQNTANAWVAGDYQSVTGETQLVATNGATWYLTGVQLEVGSTATSFDYRPYGTELALCQRYCINYRSADAGVYMRYGCGFAQSTTTLEICVNFPVQMRTTPSLSVTATASNYAIYIGSSVNPCNLLPAIDGNSDNPLVTSVSAGSSVSHSGSGGGGILSNNNTTSYMLFTAEL
jgi:hypothetical protein